MSINFYSPIFCFFRFSLTFSVVRFGARVDFCVFSEIFSPHFRLVDSAKLSPVSFGLLPQNPRITNRSMNKSFRCSVVLNTCACLYVAIVAIHVAIHLWKHSLATKTEHKHKHVQTPVQSMASIVAGKQTLAWRAWRHVRIS